jgi:Flp pilus assembly protein CpaB
MAMRVSKWDEEKVRGDFGRSSARRSVFMRYAAALFFLALGTAGAGVAYKQFYPTVEPIAPLATAAPIAQPAIELISIIVPTRQIERGTKLEASMFLPVQRAKSAVTEGTIRSFTELTGTYAKELIPATQPISRELVTTQKPANAVIEQIPDDMRAVTINVNSTSGVEGWARAGSQVDVQWISEVKGKKTSTEIVNNAKVLSAERKIDPEADPKQPIPTTVTLLVTAPDANKVALASTGGQLVLHMRGSDDTGKDIGDSSGPISKEDLLRGARDDQQGKRDVEGIVKIQDGRGGTQEWAIVNGRLYERDRK